MINYTRSERIANVGSKTTDAMLTLHYGNGQKEYELKQTIAPGGQMWVNLAQLVRNRVADRNGNMLPSDLNSVTYDLKDLTTGNNGLLQNEVALDSAYGFLASPQTPICCGYENLTFDPNEIGLPIGGNDPASIMGEDECNSQEDDISPSFTTWSSENTSIAQLTYKKVQGVAVGSTIGTAEGDVFIGAGGYCAYDPQDMTVPVTVFEITGISPSTGQAGGVSQVAISGTGFAAGSTVSISPAGIAVSGVTVSTDGTLINATFTVPSGATIGPYSVTVNLPGGDGSQPSNSVTFTVTNCATPVNFQRKSWTTIPSTAELDITYSWSSSDGQSSDLAACTLSEYVSYPGNPGTYTWPRPPFGQQSPNPGTNSQSGPNTFSIDKILPPASWIKPYVAASFVANQTYQYVCPCANSGNQVQLGAYTITRSVTKNSDGTFRYTVSKSSGEAATLNPIP